MKRLASELLASLVPPDEERCQLPDLPAGALLTTPAETFRAAAAVARAGKLPAATCPPFPFAVPDWITAAR